MAEHFSRCIRRGLPVFLTVFLTGCVSVTVAPDPLQSKQRADESPVVVSMTGNTAQVTAMDKITVRRIQPGSVVRANHELRQVAPGLSRDTALFIGTLPAGEYELDTIEDSDTRKFLNLSEGMRERLGHFVVEPGRPVDLGRLLVTPINNKVLVGRSSRVPSNAAMMRRFTPEHARLFMGEVSAGWMTPRAEQDRIEEYALSRPVGAAQPTELADGRVVAASRLGVVLLRTPQGRWRALRSPGLESILHAVPVNLPNARLVAAGEFSTLFRQPPESDSLVPMDTGDLPPGNLLFIAGDEKSGWYIAHQRDQEVTLFHSATLDAGQWRALRKEDVAQDFWNGANSFWIWRTEKGLGYATSRGSIHLLDFASGAWATRQAPDNDRLISITQNPDGSLGVLTSPGGGFGGVFAGTYLSQDAGLSWQKIETPFKVKVAAPLRTRDGTLLMPGGVYSDPELHASRDGGKTWQRVGEFRLDSTLAALPSGALMAVDIGQFGLFSIRHSTDGGVTWRTEYSNFDRTAYEAEEQRKKRK